MKSQFFLFFCLLLCPFYSPLGSDGWLEARVKGITLGCRTQEVLRAKRDHLAGIGPTPLPRDSGRTY